MPLRTRHLAASSSRSQTDEAIVDGAGNGQGTKGKREQGGNRDAATRADARSGEHWLSVNYRTRFTDGGTHASWTRPPMR